MRNATLGVLLLTLTGVRAGEVHGVLVGIDKYDHGDIAGLRYSVNDVRAFRDLLCDPVAGVAKQENCVLLTPDNEANLRPTRAGILVQIKKAALRTQPDDTFIFYFAGHGMQTAEGQFLLGVDTDPLLLADTAVPLGRLPEILAEVKARRILIIIDACRNDPAAGRAQADNPLGEAFARGLRPGVLSGPAVRHTIATWLACEVGQRAWELTDKQHGVFSHFLLEGLRGAAAEGDIDLAALADYVTKNVTEWARRNAKEQTPKLDNPDGLTLVLGRPKRGGPVRQVPVCTLEIGGTPAGATVLIDGEAVGTIPFKQAIQLPQGEKTITLTLQAEGHQPALKEIVLKPAGSVAWEKDLKPLTPGRTEPVKAPAGPDLSQTPPPAVKPVQEGPQLEGWSPGPDGLPMVEVPAGKFTMGARQAAPNEGPPHEVTLAGYRIHAHEVTNQAYAAFLNLAAARAWVTTDAEGNVVTGAGLTALGWEMGTVLLWSAGNTHDIRFDPRRGQFTVAPGRDLYPVTRVTWHGAWCYAGFYGLALPTEAQWERAALAADGRSPYPWGATYQAALANLGSDQLQPVNSLPGARSGVGALHMVGNAWEWCRDFYVADYHRRRLNDNPWIGASDGDDVLATIRGGGYTSLPDAATVRTRQGIQPWDIRADVGFRCVQEAAGGAAQGQFTPLKHPLTGVTLAIPEGFTCELVPPMQVAVLQSDDFEGGLFYFPVSTIYQDVEMVLQTMLVEANNLGFVATAVVQNMPIDVGNPAFQVFRRAWSGMSNGEPYLVSVDVVRFAGRFHAFVLAGPPEEAQALSAPFAVLVTATDFPD